MIIFNLDIYFIYFFLHLTCLIVSYNKLFIINLFNQHIKNQQLLTTHLNRFNKLYGKQ